MHPSGIFQINNIKPGNYVLIVGPEPSLAKVIKDGNRPLIYEVMEGDILDIETIYLLP